MDISIIISTYNRSDNLPECIECLATQENTENFDWEAIIVDNNSTDDTKLITDKLQKKYSINIRYLFEPNQGLSFARNCGIKESDAEFIIFIDDDIRATPKWLASIYNRFISENCDAVGGRIYIENPNDLPKWISPDMYGFLGHRDFGDQAFQMNGRDEFPFGGNMSATKEITESIGGFDTRMGRKGEGNKREELFKGEETEFFHQLTDMKGTIWYEPDAIVLHKILPYQLKKKFFRTLHFNAGYQKANLEEREFQRTFGGIPLFIFPQTLRAFFRYLTLLITTGADNVFRQQMNIIYFIGMINGYRDRYIRTKEH